MADYTGAPYNFVPITKHIYKRYQTQEDLPRHDIIDTKRYSGELTCRITALTDLFIGGGKDVKKGEYSSFAQCVDGTPCIPGSSLKGLVRSNMQVLGFGSIAGDVENYHIMYRQVGAAKSRVSRYYTENILNVKTIKLGKDSRGNHIQTTVPANVKAGYLKKEGSSYMIYPTEADAANKEKFGERNYYPVSEQTVFRAKEEAEAHGKKNPFSFFEDLGIQMQHKNDCKSSDFTIEKDNGNRIHVKGPESEMYVPYTADVFYRLKGEPGNYKVVSVLKQEGLKPEGYQAGSVISTGKMQEKKVFYVIPKWKEESAIPVPKADIASFKRDYENKKNGLHGRLDDSLLKEQCRKFFELPEDGERKPVFYIERGGRLYFGYTPFLRIFYEHPVLHGISKEQMGYMKENGDLKEPVFDYPSAILGYASENGSYKSRVSFADFRLQIPEHTDRKQYINEMQYRVQITQGAPKLSSYWDYLVQDNDEYAMTYNEDEFELRGIKQYWLQEHAQAGGEVKNEEAASRFMPFKNGVSFQGTVRFQNLSADELGLLIWSLSLEADSNQNIGRAKAFGYGRIELKLERLRLYDYQKMYGGTTLNMNIFKNQTADQINGFVRAYQEHMKQNYKKPGGKPCDIKKEPGVDAFLKMKCKECMPDKKNIRYMSIDDQEYKNRNTPLPTVDQVLTPTSGKPKRIIESKPKSDGRKGGYQDPEGKKNPTMAGLFAGIKLEE